jgi:toxin ParE1/3/4
MRHILSPQAASDLEEIWRYIATESDRPAVADQVIDSIARRVSWLASNPYIGRSRNDLRAGVRSFVAGNYVIFYRVQGQDVAVLRILHGRRDIVSLFRDAM